MVPNICCMSRENPPWQQNGPVLNFSTSSPGGNVFFIKYFKRKYVVEKRGTNAVVADFTGSGTVRNYSIIS